MYIWVYGSYAKKKQKKNSDIDIIVRTEDVSEGFKIVEVKFALVNDSKRKVWKNPHFFVFTGEITIYQLPTIPG